MADVLIFCHKCFINFKANARKTEHGHPCLRKCFNVSRNLMKPLIILIILLIQTIAYEQTFNIEGHWRRADLAQKSKDSSVQFGDLLLNPNKTFTSVGYDRKSKGEILGWHSGGTIKGTWTFSHKILSLKIENVGLPINYQVESLNSSELIFVDPLNKTVKLKFKRIKDIG
jgi:hypothetical protein